MKKILRLAAPVIFRRGYLNKVLGVQSSSLIGFWPLNEESGLVANDISPEGNDAVIPAAGITYSEPGPPVGGPSMAFDGNDTHINLGSAGLADDWDGDNFSMIAWGKVDGAARWTDNTTYRYLNHIRSATETTYYAVMGKSSTNHQLEWRRRTGGAITSATHTFAPTGTLDWFCMGMTFELATPTLTCYLWDKVSDFQVVDTSNSANLTTWDEAGPSSGASVLMAGSVTLQEWIGWGALGALWNKELTQPEMKRVMSP